MNMRVAGLSLALLGGAAMLAPNAAQAANVGYYDMSSGTGQSWQANLITAAGHTPVLVETPDAATLATLDGLFVVNPSNGGFGSEYTSNLPAISAAVNNGLVFILFDRNVTSASSNVPGASGITITRETEVCGDINLPAGSPLISGPGGTLNDTVLDGYSCSSHGYVVASTLPAGSAVWANRADTSQGTEVFYPSGAGKVVYSTSPLDAFYPYPGFNTLGVNTIACAFDSNCASGSPILTCASEGYTGTKLTWCRNICEMGYTGATLKMWIRRWVDRYHDEPYCMVEEQPMPL